MALPKTLKNFLLFNNGVGYLGEVPEVTLPKLTRKMEEYRAGGMAGPMKLDMGMEAMTMEWTAAGYLLDVFTQFGVTKHDDVMLRFAGALQSDDDDGVTAVEVICRGRHSEIDPGTAKAGEKTELKVKTELTYLKLSVNGVPVIEIDLVNMIEVVGGVDRLAQVRAALGI